MINYMMEFKRFTNAVDDGKLLYWALGASERGMDLIGIDPEEMKMYLHISESDRRYMERFISQHNKFCLYHTNKKIEILQKKIEEVNKWQDIK
jgi:altronate dehydratase